MPSPESVLSLLRTDPTSALYRYGFVVANSIYQNSSVGGSCQLRCSSVNDNVFLLTAEAGSTDYYYPYVNGAKGVGSCKIPIKSKAGTIAVTGGMNGCSLQVNKTNSDFYFYHDNNGKGIANAGVALPGNMVARLDYKTYEGPFKIGDNLSADLSGGASRAGDEYYCISVLIDGTWIVYVSSLIRTTTQMTSFFGNDYSNVAFTPFRPSVYPRMLSFD